MDDVTKGTVTSLASLFPADEAQKAAKHVEDAIAEKQKELDKLHHFTSNNNNLLKLVQRLPDELSHDVMVPFGKAAFFPGRLVHTNEILVLLGEGYYTERTSKQTVEILHRRKKTLDEHVETLQAMISDLKGEASFFNATAKEVAEDFFDIIETDSEERTSERMSGLADSEGSSDKIAINVADGDEEYDRIMARLDELEREELAAESVEEGDEDEDAKDVTGCSISQDFLNKSLKISEEHQPQLESKNFHNLAAKRTPSGAKLQIAYHNDTEAEDKKDRHSARGMENPAGITGVAPTGPELVAAVANAGAIGTLRAPYWECPDYLRELIRKTRALTDEPFGVGVVLAFPHKENLKAILDEKVGVLQVSWGEFPEELVLEAHQAGVKVVHQVGSYEEAEKAVKAGVDAIIVQGREAGGHVIGQDGLMSLLPKVVDLAAGSDIPIIAAGSIVNGRGYVAALALGAQGICLGTRFVATEESFAHPTYKKKLVEINKSEYTHIYGRARWPGAPQRVLQTPFFIGWRHLPDHETEANQPVVGRSVIHGMEKEIRRFAGTVPNATTTGDIESMVMYAGEGVGHIKEILPAGEVVQRLVEEAKLVIKQQFVEDAKVI